MKFVKRVAATPDIEELLGLYWSSYGEDYPLLLGTDKRAMKAAIEDQENYYWLTIREELTNSLAASCIIEIDRKDQIGKVTGVTVSKNFRGHGLAKEIIGAACSEILDRREWVKSLYATSRTLAVSAQSMLLANGFIPLGIFPNARKIHSYETLTLMGKFNPLALESRASVERLPAALAPIYHILDERLGTTSTLGVIEPCPDIFKARPTLSEERVRADYEFIFAPKFVERRFQETFSDDADDVFYPFHRPNLLISSQNKDIELYASFSKKDHYCVLMSANRAISSLGDEIKELIFAMKDMGIYYIETLVRVDHFNAICFLTQNRFLPSALYPAMKESDGKMHDYVLLTRTMVPLDFTELQIHESFRPYLEQYSKMWIESNLKSFEVEPK